MTATCGSPSSSTSSVGSSTTVYSPAKHALEAALQVVRRDRREEADAAEVDADHGHAAAEQPRERAQDRPVAAERDGEIGVARLVDDLDAGARSATARARARRASLDVDAAVRDDRGGANRPRPLLDSLVEVIGKRRVVGAARGGGRTPGSPSGPGSPESTTPTTLAPQPSAAAATSRSTRRVHLRVAHDAALADVRAARLELRLHEHDRLPARRGERSAGGSAMPHRDEGDVADDELGANGSSVELARVRPLEHDRRADRARSLGCSCP